MNAPRLVCSDCGRDFDSDWFLPHGCPDCGCKYVTPSHRWQPRQMRLFPVPR